MNLDDEPDLIKHFVIYIYEKKKNTLMGFIYLFSWAVEERMVG